MENIKLRILFTIFLIGGISIIFTATTLQIYAQNKTEEKTMKMQNALGMIENMTMKDMVMMMTQTEDNNDTSQMNKNNMSMK